MALPTPAHASRRDRVAAPADLVGKADLAKGGLLQGELDDQGLNLGRRRFARMGLRRVSSCSASSPPVS